MAQRILVIDTDADFTGTLKAGFGALGVSVEVVEDGDVGVSRASAERPDVILLAIELGGVNGFLVCKKIKKSGDLKDIPLIILSSEASDEIFEQHGKLRTRAEDYVHKPVAFDVLLERVRRLVPIGVDADGELMEDEQVSIIDDDEPLVEAELDAEAVVEERPAPSRAGVDADIDAFADNAFGNLMMDGEATSIGAVPEAIARDLAARQEASAAAAQSDGARSDPATEPPPPPSKDSRADGTQDGAELAALREQVSALRQGAERVQEHEQAARRAAAEIVRLEREVADLKARATKGGGGGVSSREFLDLREGLNRKDKEILELRDQVTTRDRQALDANDRGLALERKVADLEDKVAASERALDEAKAKQQALVADHEQLEKRADDVKGRLERAEQKAKKLEAELDAEKVGRAKALSDASAEAQSELEAARATATAELERVKAQLAAELEAATAAAAQEVVAAKAAAAKELAEAKEAHEAAVTRAAAEHAEALAASEAAHGAALVEAQRAATAARETALAQLRAELEAANAAALAAAQSEREVALATAKAEDAAALEQALARANDEQGRELAVLGRKLAEAEAQVTSSSEALEATVESGLVVQQNLDARVKELAAVHVDLAAITASRDELDRTVKTHVARIAELDAANTGLESKLAHALAKLDGDAQLLERVRKALAIAGALLEEQQRRPTDGA